MDRREFVQACALLGAGAAVGAGGVLLGQTVLAPPDKPAPSPLRWPNGGADMTLADIDAATERFVQGEWADGPVVVVAVPVAALRAASLLRGVNTGQYAVPHPSDATRALVAYDGRCTHLGCTVGWNPTLGASKDVADYDGDGANEGRILCPCHQSQFDVHDLGTNVPGQPAPRPLAALRLRIEGGVLIGVERIAQARRHAADRDGAGAAFALATQA